MNNKTCTKTDTDSRTGVKANSIANADSRAHTDTVTIPGARIWDEIFKAIVNTMPEQLFPLFKEVFGKEYPPGTPISLLATEYSTYTDDPAKSPSSNLMDITLLVAGTDYYHLECQMHNDSRMVLRMISYDLHCALQHTVSPGSSAEEVIIRFPHSAVIYPEPNNALPGSLRCRILFPDQTEYVYQVPTVRIQSYTLEQIRQKHLILFLPYTLLRLRPKMAHVSLTKEELTAFVNEVIVILEEEVASGRLTQGECCDYIQLLLHASQHIFKNKPEYHQEVLKVTKPLIKLPSVELRETWEALEKAQAELADKKAELADRTAELADRNAELADRDAEIARLRKLLFEQGIPVPQS